MEEVVSIVFGLLTRVVRVLFQLPANCSILDLGIFERCATYLARIYKGQSSIRHQTSDIK